MKTRHKKPLSVAVRTALLLAALPFTVHAQQGSDSAKTLDAVQVTGSRIKQTDAVTQAPVSVITRAQIEKTGVTSVGELLQQVTGGGAALNAKFNSSGVTSAIPPMAAVSARVRRRSICATSEPSAFWCW